MPFADTIRIHGSQRPTRTAIVHGERRINYRELDRRIDAACWALHEAGIRYGEVVGLGLRDTMEHLILLFSLARMGAVIAPLDCRWAPQEMTAVATHIGVSKAIVERAAAGLPAEWLRLDDAWFEGEGQPYFDAAVTAETKVILSLSSGTTGMPKGPAITQQQFESRFSVYFIDLGLNAQDRFISATPLYFGGGRGFAMAALVAGATVYFYPPPFKPEQLAEYVRQTNGTWMFLVPTLLRRMLDAGLPGMAFPTLSRLISSGSALYREEKVQVRERLSANLYELYSATEGGSISVLPPDYDDAQGDTVGLPCFRVEVNIVDANFDPVAPGEAGRLCYRSPGSATDYAVGDPGDAFHDGWFFPGDLATRDEQGYLRLRGRSKDMIIRGGINIYPGDVEGTLMTHPQVLDVAVIGVPAREMGEELMACVVISGELGPEEIRAFCKDRLAPYKVPRYIEVLESLPKNSLGKTLKNVLKERYGMERV